MRVAVTVEQSWHVVPGGIATVTVELLRALRTHPDLDLVGIAARHPGPPREDLVPPVPVRHAALPRRALYGAWQWLGVPKVEATTGAVDLVHDAGYVVPPTRAPLVATVHDLLFLAYPDHYTPGSLTVLRRGLERARRHAALVVCPSQATMRACRDAGIEAERLRLVPWGFRRVEVGPGSTDRVLERHGVREPFVLFCGTVEPRKNLHRVLEAFRSLESPDLTLVLVGPRGWREDIGTDVAALGDRVATLGVVSREDLAALYLRTAALVYPSLAEGFGLPVLEAMAYGAPVVTSKGTATEEIAGDAGVLVDPLDTDAIAAGVASILDDAALASRLSDRARHRAASYTWERSADMIAAVYADAVGGGP